MGLFGVKAQEDSLLGQNDRLRRLEIELAEVRARLEETRELVRHLDEDKALLLAALASLRPGMPPRELA